MKAILSTLVLLMALSAQAMAIPQTPNPEWAQGSLCDTENDDYTEDRYDENIPYCKRNVSSSLKKEIFELYGIPEKCHDRYTIDHIIPLAIGGDNSMENLWPEHKKIKATRPNLEMEVYTNLKNGKIKQKRAIAIILKEKFESPNVHFKYIKCD